MPAFSRGLDGFLRHHTLRLSSLRSAAFATREHFFPSPRLHESRSFTSSILRRYQYPTRTPPRSRTTITNDPVLRRVTQTRLPVTIYEAPQNRWYYLKVYGTAGIWMGVGAYSIKFNYDIEGRGLSFFVRPTYIAVGLAFVAIGCYISTAPVNRMRALEIVPSLQGGPMQLRMAVRTAPWARERVIYASLGEVTISEKTEPMVQELLEADRAWQQKVWEDMEHLPFTGRVLEGSMRWLHQQWTNFFLRFKFAVLRFGIAKVEVQGEQWKIDCSGSLLEDGRAIDRIIPVD